MALINPDCDAMRSPSIMWLESPRIVLQCAPRASNGPNHLGSRARQDFPPTKYQVLGAEVALAAQPPHPKVGARPESQARL